MLGITLKLSSLSSKKPDVKTLSVGISIMAISLQIVDSAYESNDEPIFHLNSADDKIINSAYGTNLGHSLRTLVVEIV